MKEKEEREERSEEKEEKEKEGARFPDPSGALGQIEQTGALLTRSRGHLIHTVSIIGQIEGHYVLSEGQKSTKYEHLIPMLVAAENSDAVDGVLLLLNTMGGDVEAGLAIAELIAGMRTPTVSLVLGGGHSIGVPLAVCTDLSFIVPSATMMLHPVRTTGLVLGVKESFSYFYRMQDRIVRFISEHSRTPAERVRQLMLKTGEIPTDMGSVLDGEMAVREGLIDRVGGISDALDALEARIGAAKDEKGGVGS